MSLFRYYYIFQENKKIIRDIDKSNEWHQESLFFLFDSIYTKEIFDSLILNDKESFFQDVVLRSNLANVSIVSICYEYLKPCVANRESRKLSLYQDCILEFIIHYGNFLLFEDKKIIELIMPSTTQTNNKIINQYNIFKKRCEEFVSYLGGMLCSTTNQVLINKLITLDQKYLLSFQVSKNLHKKQKDETLKKKKNIENILKQKSEMIFINLNNIFLDSSDNNIDLGSSVSVNYLWFYKITKKIEDKYKEITKILKEIISVLKDNDIALSYYFSQFEKILSDISFCYLDSKFIYFYSYFVNRLLSHIRETYHIDMNCNYINKYTQEIKFLKNVVDRIEINLNEPKYRSIPSTIIDFKYRSNENQINVSDRIMHIEKAITKDKNLYQVIIFKEIRNPLSLKDYKKEYKKERVYRFSYDDNWFVINGYHFDFPYTEFFADFISLIINVIAINEKMDLSINQVDSKQIYKEIKGLIK